MQKRDLDEKGQSLVTFGRMHEGRRGGKPAIVDGNMVHRPLAVVLGGPHPTPSVTAEGGSEGVLAALRLTCFQSNL